MLQNILVFAGKAVIVTVCGLVFVFTIYGVVSWILVESFVKILGS